MEEYRNILANKFMRDTNYIIIKDTDDLEELERQWELFQSSLTVRQQRLSDDRSLQIWNMTNQQHYEALKIELMGDLQNKLGIEDDEPTSIEYEPDDNEKIDDSEITNFVNMSFDDFEIPDDENEINEPIKEDSIIPTDGKELNEKQKLDNEIKANMNKDAQADQYEIDSNINIIGSIKGFTPQERLDNLEKAFIDWNSQNQDHRKKSDDKCREIYGMSNIDRYNKIKGSIIKTLKPEKDDVKGNNNTNTTNDIKSLGEFVSMVYSNMQVVNESESNANKQHRRLNDTPYFTPSEMIDMGVHGNHNYYCKDADNDGLITRVRIPTWFDSYKDMCMDHIFEDYTKDWIDTLDYLYSDFEEIKESGNEEKILARKQSILDLGWNPEIPFTRRNRQLASKRVSKLLDKSSPMNLFINLDKEVPDEAITDEPITENASKDTHQPIYMIFVQGKAPVVSTAIKKVTNSPFSHTGISFDSKLDTVHTYNMVPKPGVVKETLSGYKDNVITVMAFFAPTDIYNTMKDTVMDYYINAKKTVYDWGIIFNKLINKNARVVNDKYHQVCSTFVDTILKSGKVTLDKDANVPSPAELYNATKSMPNKIIEVYSGPADKYNSAKVDKKMNKLLEKGVASINESKLTDKIRSKKADMDLELTAKTYDALSHLTKDEKKKAEMKKKAISARSMKGLLDFNEASLPKGITLRQATTADTDNMIEWELDSVDKSVKNDSKVINYIKQDVKKSIKDTKIIMDGSKTIGMLTTCPIDNGEWWYIGEIYLIPEYRGKGIGSELLKEQIRNHDKIKLQVGYSNNKAKRLYESLGFKVIDKNDNGRFYLMSLDKTDSVNERYIFFEPVREAVYKDITNYKDPCISYAMGVNKSITKLTKQGFNITEDDGDYKVIFDYSNRNIWESFINDNLQDTYWNEYIRLKDITIHFMINENGKIKHVINKQYESNDSLLKTCNRLCNGDYKDIKSLIYSNDFYKEVLSSHTINESVLNEVKQFPVEFDQDGNLIIYKAHIGSIAYGDEIDDSVKLLESYRNTNNIEGMKYELAKLWFINDSIEKKLKKKLTNDQYKELIDNRATCLNVFKLNLEYVMKAEKGFNFSDYYNSTPFSDNSIKITANTLKYSMKAIASMI